MRDNPHARFEASAGTALYSAIRAVTIAGVCLTMAGACGANPTEPTPASERIAEHTKVLARIATADLIQRVLPAIRQREFAATGERDLRELECRILADQRRAALGLIAPLRNLVRAANDAAQAGSDDPTNLVAIVLYLDWVERTL